jgi:hypothetical protein
MLLLSGILATLALPTLALRGRGNRSFYFRASLAAFVFGAVYLWLGWLTPDDKPDPAPAEFDGTAFMNEYFPIVGIVLIVAGLQAIIAGLLRPAAAPPQPEWLS